VIGSDQVCTLDDLQIGKPGTHDKALAQVQLMRGRPSPSTPPCACSTRRTGAAWLADADAATFRNLSDAELDAYLRIETPTTAPAAPRRGPGHRSACARESDDPTALIGLPLIALTGMLRQVGYPFFGA
jgi:septum formation protein